MDYIKAIEIRRSVRTYNPDKSLSDKEISTIQEAIDSAWSPFGGDVAVKLHRFDLEGKQTPSTYGSVSGASWYMLVGFAEDRDSALSAGFKQAQVALKIFSMGLGTNWMTDTFRGGVFKQAAGFPDSTPLRVIMPVGYPAEKPRLMEKLTHKMLGSASRKPFDSMFFSGDFEHPVATGSPFYKPLEYMHSAPSAYNKQPWRALVKGNKIYFYQEPGQESLIGMGIGLAQFYFSLLQLGHTGNWGDTSDAPAHKGWEPITSFSISD
ncbi:MAG: hypothetical protein K2M87_07395 [Muribaculaceae bacterium]|nr:hypothetical protein [Muribaculaceae bacterium]